MQIKFIEFNKISNSGIKEAAQFDIIDDKGESHCLWMSKQDIKRNIKAFTESATELKKAL